MIQEKNPQLEPIELEKEDEVKKSENKGKIYFLVIYLISVIAGFFFQWFNIIALITIIAGHLKYPRNKTLKVFFYLSVVIVVIWLVLILIFSIMLVYACEGVSRIRC